MSTLSTTPSTADIPLRERANSTAERVTDQFETSSLDDRSYRVIKLKNQLEVLLAHDAETDKASAAMDVNVGSFSDPEDIPGLAHFVEHMLSMGTKKAKSAI
jgi:insulysin